MRAENLKLVEGMYVAFHNGNIDAVVAAMAPDVKWENLGNPEHYPVLGARKGPDAVRAFFEEIQKEHTFNGFVEKTYIADGDWVVVLGEYKATIHKTGRTVAAEFAHVYQLSGGKVVHMREFTDTAAWSAAYHDKDTAKGKHA